MLAPKASGRATESVKAPRGIDQLGGRIDHEATTPAKLGAQAPDRGAMRPNGKLTSASEDFQRNRLAPR